MARFIIRRLLSLVPTLFLIVTLSFFIIKIAPGGPFSADRNLHETILQNINKKYHLDEPLPQQYLRYLADVLRGDLGPSFRYQDHDVNYLIAQSLPHSILLGVTALCIAVIQPEVGSQCSHMASTSMSTGPITNSGTEMPMMATDMLA
jgi:oligopeptide transport system permease protein